MGLLVSHLGMEHVHKDLGMMEGLGVSWEHEGACGRVAKTMPRTLEAMEAQRSGGILEDSRES